MSRFDFCSLILAVLILWLAACGDDATDSDAATDDDVTSDTSDLLDGADLLDGDASDVSGDVHTNERAGPLLAIPESERFELTCLEAPAYVLRTEVDHPHIYAETETDLACVHGFVTARDRFFEMDMARRLGLGRLSELLGALGLPIDVENTSIGLRRMADSIRDSTDEAVMAQWDAFAEGVNAYIRGARDGLFAVPSEFEAAYLLLGAREPADLLLEWSGEDLAGIGATLLFQASFENSDISHQAVLDRLGDWAAALPDSDLRLAGARDDIFGRVAPTHEVVSAPDFRPGAEKSGRERFSVHPWVSGPEVEQGMLERADARLRRMSRRFRRDYAGGFGSNGWAVGASMTADGVPIVAGDGHLALTAPTTFYLSHLDTQLLGDGETHAVGLSFPGLPLVVVGTNGRVAWTQTQLLGDVVDWYREEIVIEDGRPVASRFRGEDLPLVEVPESYVIGNGVQISRWETSGGRHLVELEGVVVSFQSSDANAVNISGQWIVAEDLDDDGLITGISVAYSGHFERGGVGIYYGFSHAESVEELAQLHRSSAAVGANFIAADVAGGTYYSGFQAMPCRNYLTRDDAGVPVPGANPLLLIDGTQYPSWQVHYDSSGNVDPRSQDETDCVLAFEDFPHALSPAQDYVLNANNDPFGTTFDNNLWNDDIYLGSPWTAGHRARQIETRLVDRIGEHTIDTIREIQADHRAPMGEEYTPYFLAALDLAETAFRDGETTGALGRMAGLYGARQAEIDEARGRVEAWRERGYEAPSGVVTQYNPGPLAASTLDDSVATMVFHSWYAHFASMVYGDEALPEIWDLTNAPWRTLYFLMEGRGTENVFALSSHNPATGESVFFDDVSSEEVESSDELIVAALVAALDYLASEDLGDGAGGFGTPDQDTWLWGLKHMVRLPSLVTAYVDDEGLGAIVASLAITTENLPLDDPAPDGADPRASLTGFPRPGAIESIDVAGRGTDPFDYTYTHGPVMRIAIALDPDGVYGYNVIPGGQSGLSADPHFADTAALWLGNQTIPIRFSVDDVIAGATGRETLLPAP